MKKEKGITLVALIVTIIILIILTAVTINNTLGENGLIDMATEALVRTQIAEYQEELDQIGMITTADNVFNKITEKEYLEKFQEKVNASELFKDKKSAEIMEEEGEETKLRIVTKEGYVFDVVGKEVSYVGKIGEKGFEPLPEIKTGSITINLEKDKEQQGEYINKVPLYATITVSGELADSTGLTIQYTNDPKSKWTNYTTGDKIEIRTNCTIYVRVKNNIGDTSAITASETINNIDTIKPEAPTDIEATEVTTNSMKVTAKAKDVLGEDETHYQEQSGIKEMVFELTAADEDKKTETIPVEADKTEQGTAEYTFTDLKQNKEYTITVKAIDKAGNESTETTKPISTIEVPGGDLGTGAITFSCDPDPKTTPWTNSSVKVTITISQNYKDKGYKIEYTTTNPVSGGAVWTPYDETEKVTMETNGTIYVRLKDSTNQAGTVATATETIKHIDKNPPSKPDIKIEGTLKEGTEDTYTSEITVTITPGIDPAGESGVSTTTYNTTVGPEKPQGTLTGTGAKSITLKTDGTYTITATTTDNAENTSKANAVTVTKKSASPLIDAVTVSNYGDYVNYPVDLDGNSNTKDWKIFYKDSNGRIFIIAADLVPLANFKNTLMSQAGTFTSYGNYGLKWTCSTYNTIPDSILNLFITKAPSRSGTRVPC